MSDRELFKELKELKLFSTFYIACAQAWAYKRYNKPRALLRVYLENTAKRLMTNERERESYIDGITNRWNLKPPIVKVI
jgi:hypothetical protein